MTAAQCIASMRAFGWICVALGGGGQDSSIASRPVVVYTGRSYSIIRSVVPFVMNLITGLLQDGVLDMYYGIYMVDLSSYV